MITKRQVRWHLDQNNSKDEDLSPMIVTDSPPEDTNPIVVETVSLFSSNITALKP